MKKLRKSSSLNLHPNPETTFDDYVKNGLEFLKSAGFDAADLSMRLVDLTNDNWQPSIESAIKNAEESGVKFELCHLPFGAKVSVNSANLPVFNEKMHRAIDAAAMLGVDYAVLHPNTSSLHMSKYDEKTEREDSIAHLSPFVEHAERVGVKIVVENMRVVHENYPVHRYCQTPEELCDLADALGIGVCWDFGHANISGVKQSKGLEYVGKRLKVLHVNDNFSGDDIHILPFTGNVDWRDAMHGLALAGFDGLFNFELSVARVSNELRGDFATYASHAADELMSYIE